MYVGKRVPDEYRKPGAANPIKYTWKKLPKGKLPKIDNADYMPSRQQIDAVLAYLPTFERADFVPSRIEDSPGVMPYHIFDDELTKFHEAVYANGFVFPFEWVPWEARAQEYFERPELLNTADMQTIRKLITFHARKQRFCDGHLPEMVECGHIAAILRRLKELKPLEQG